MVIAGPHREVDDHSGRAARMVPRLDVALWPQRPVKRSAEGALPALITLEKAGMLSNVSKLHLSLGRLGSRSRINKLPVSESRTAAGCQKLLEASVMKWAR